MICFLAAGAVLLAAFVARERYTRDPMLPLVAFAHRLFTVVIMGLGAHGLPAREKIRAWSSARSRTTTSAAPRT